MKYCKDALKILGKKVICGQGCPIYGLAGADCPRLIIENANDIAIEKAILALLKIKGGT